MTPHLPILVFSDVDDVLGYSDARACAEAAKTLNRLECEEIPLVLCSNGTRAEIEEIRLKLGIHHPFVCERGGAAFIPAGYFPFAVPKARDLAGYQVVEFGWPYAEVLHALHRTAARLRIGIVGFNEMSVEDVARDCNLPLLQARLAKLREYGERFRVLDPSETTRRRLVKALETAGLSCITGERYDQVGATMDSSVGVSVLRALYKRALGVVLTVGSADALADRHVLQFFNRRVVVSEDDRKHGIDVVGWAEAILDVVERLRRQGSRLSIQ